MSAALAFSLLLPSFALAFVLTESTPASGAIPPINQRYLVPLSEAQLLDTFEELTGNAADANITNVVSVIAVQTGVVIEYDHWEDGFEVDEINPTQFTTEVWGDEDASNGCAGLRKSPPINPCTDADDLVYEGDVFITQNNIPSQPRNDANIFFDGGDKIVASSAIVVSQAGQPQSISGSATLGSLLGGAVQVYDSTRYGTEFIMPVGEDLIAGDFNRLGEYTTVFVMATEDNTTVNIDADADGTTDFTRVLNEGESIHMDQDLTTGTDTYTNRTDYDISAQVVSGTRITASAPIQAYAASGSRESDYQARFFELVPVEDWDNEYYAPVPTITGTTTGLFLYNPDANPISVTLEYRDGSTTLVTVPAMGSEIANLPLAQTTSGVKLTSANDFFAVSLINTNDSTARSDWGYTLLPADGLSRSIKAGWAPGSAVTTENSNPIWFVVTDDAIVYIDFEGDGIGVGGTAPNGEAYDLAVPLEALEVYQLLEADNNQTGTRIFTLDNASIAGAWGQNGLLASGAEGGLDLGTTVFPGPAIAVNKNAALQSDVNGNGLVDPGDIVEFTVLIENDSTVAASGSNLLDVPDPDLLYIADSSTIDGVPTPDQSTPNTPYPFDETGYAFGLIPPGTDVLVTYQMSVNPDIDTLKREVINTVTLSTSLGGGVSSKLIRIKHPSFAIRKVNDDADGLVDPGQVVTYTVELSNADELTQSNIRISDLLPAGLTYVPNSTVAVGANSDRIAHGVRDEFTTQSYANNDGPDNWLANWNEINDNNNAASGEIRVQGGTAWFNGIDNDELRRTVDLSDPTVTFATLRFDYDVTDIGNEGLEVLLRNSTGGWDLIKTLDDNLQPTGTINHIMTADQVYAGTEIRMQASDNGWSTGEIALVDNVTILWDTGSTSAVTLDNDPAGAFADLVEGDPTAGDLVVPADGFALAEGDKLIVTFQATVDNDALGDLTNSATGMSAESPDPQSDDDVVTVVQPMTMDLTKTDTYSGSGAVGETIDYDITITNTSFVPVSNIDITDSLTDADGNLSCTPVEPFTLAAGASATCTTSHDLTQADLDAGEVVNVVTATGEDFNGDPVVETSDDPDDPTDVDPNGDGNPDDPTITPIPQSAELQATKVDTLNGTGVAGDTIDYDIVVTNTGNVTIDSIAVTDSLADADATVTCIPVEPFDLAPGASATCTSTHTVTQTEVDAGLATSNVVAAGTDPASNSVTDQSDDPADPADVDPEGDGEPDDFTDTPLTQDAELRVFKTDTINGTDVGDTIDYAITVTNNGSVTVSNIDLVDSLADADSSLSCTPSLSFTLAPGAGAICSATHTITQADLDSGSVTNVVTATGEDPAGDPVVDASDDPDDPTNADPDADGEPDDPTISSLPQSPELQATKVDTLNGTGVAGDTIDYDIVVTNTGNVTIDSITVADSLADADATLTCTPIEAFALAPGASATCTSTHTVTQAEVDAGLATSNVTAAGTDPGGAAVTDLSDDPADTADVDPEGDGEPDDFTDTPLTQSRGLNVTKTDTLNGTGIVGDTIDYTITVINNGTVSLQAISVSDSLVDADSSIDCSPTTLPAGLAPGGSFTCTATHTVTQAEVDAGSVINVATASGTDLSLNPVSDASDDPDDPTNVDPDGNGNPDDPTMTPLLQTAELQVTKVDTLNGAGVTGDTVDYTIVVTNTGTVTVDGITVADSLADADGTLACVPVEPFTLAAGASATCTSTHPVTLTEVNAGVVVSNVTASGTDPDGASVVDDSDDPDIATDVDPDADGEPDDPTVTPLNSDGALEVTKVDTLNGTGAVGDTIDYAISIENTGTVTLTDVDVSDSLADADASLSCVPAAPASLTPTATMTCTATHTVTQADVDAGEVVNTASASGIDPASAPIGDSSDDPDDATDVDPDADGEPDDPTVTPLAQAAALNVVKTDALNGTGNAGDTIDYTITVTNAGNVTVDNIDMTDSLADADANVSCTPVEAFTLTPGASATCTATHTITQAEVDAGIVENTATATGTDPGNNPVTDDSDDPDNPTDVDPDGDGNPDDPTETTLTQNPELTVTKTDALNGTGSAGDTIDYTITVANAGNVTVDNIDMTDSLADADSNLSCTPVEAFTLAPSASASCTATHTITQTEVDNGQVENTATATGTDPGNNPVTDDSDDPDNPTDVDPDGDGNPDDPTETTLTQNPELTVTKTDALNGAGAVGDTIDYTITVANTGNVTVDNINVSDNIADADASLSCTPVEAFTLAPGASASCTATHTIDQSDVDNGQVDNTATATGTDPGGTPVSDDGSVNTPLAQAAGLIVTKIDTLNGTGIAGDTIDYAIVVSNTGNVSLSAIALTDSLADADASLDCSPAVLPAGLAPGGSFSCSATHTVTQADVDTGSVTNVVTAAGVNPSGTPVSDASDDPDDITDNDPDGDGEPDDPTVTTLNQNAQLQATKVDTLNGTGVAGDTIDYAITVTNTGTVTVSGIDVTDSLGDADATVSCTPAEAFTLVPGASATCTSTHTVTQAEVNAGQVASNITATGTTAGGAAVTDLSDDPDDPTDADTEGDGEPDDLTVTPLSSVTDLQVTKVDTLNGTGLAGDTIDYDIVVTNAGTTELTDVSIADSLSDANASLDCSPRTLPTDMSPSDSFTCTATHTITQTEVNAGRVINTVAGNATDSVGSSVNDSSDDPDDPTDDDPDADGEPDDPTITPLNGSPGLNVTKVDTLNGTGIAGDTIDYVITVSNTGTVSNTIDTVVDSNASLTCAPTVLPIVLDPGDSFTCDATHPITQPEVDAGSVTNSATASGTDNLGDPIADDSDDPSDLANIDPDGDGNPDDPTVTPLSQVPSVQVTKVDTLNGTGVAGDTVDYAITITNTGSVSLTNIGAVDSLVDADGTLTCTPPEGFSLLPGSSATCTSTHTVTQAEVDAGQVASNVTVTAASSAGPVSDLSDDPDDPTNADTEGDGDPDDLTVTPLTPNASLEITKNDSLTGSGVAGDVISYVFGVTNTGGVTLSNVDISDSLTGVDATLDCTPSTLPTTLAPGASISCTANYLVTQSNVDAGTVTNVATASATAPSGASVTDLSDDPNDAADTDSEGDGEPDDPTTTPLSQLPQLQVTKVDVLGGTGIAGDAISYTITTQNTGTTSAIVDTVSDSLPDADTSLSCGATSLPVTLLPGESFTCTAAHTVTQAEVDAGQVSNTATATGTDHTGAPLTDDSDDPDDATDDDPDADGEPDDPTITPLSTDAQLQVVKTDSVNGSGIAGDTIDYTITVINSGTVTVDNISLSDSLADADASLDCSPTAMPASIAPGASFTCSATHTITQAEVDAGSVTNTATAAGTDPEGDPVEDDSDDPSDTTNVDPDGDGEPDDPTVTPLTGTDVLEVTKVDVLAGTGIAGDTVTYAITVANTGSTTISDISVADSLADADASLDCSPTSLPADLAPGASFTCSATHTVSQAEVDLGQVTNTVTALGTNPSGTSVSDGSDDPDDPTNDDPDGDGEPDDPTITPLLQTAELQVIKSDSLTGSGVAGDTVDYSITVVNTGTVTVDGITVADSLADADGTLTCIPAEAFTLAPGASATCTSTHTVIQAEVDAGQVVSNVTATGTDPGGATVEDLSDDPADATDDDTEGDGEPDDPTVTPLSPVAELQVTKTDVLAGAGNAGDTVNYTIEVTNTGTVTVDGISVSDSLADADGTLSCTPAEAFTLAPGASATCTSTHTLTQAEVDAGFVSSSATATGTDPGGATVDDLSDDPDDATNNDTEADGEPDDPTVTPLIADPELQVTKTDTLVGPGEAGDTVDYAITVTNTGNVTVDGITVADSLADADSSLTCTPAQAFTLAPGASATCTSTHTLTQAEVDAGFVSSSVTAEGTEPSGRAVTDLSDDPDDGTDTDTEADGEPDDPTVTPITTAPELSVTKTDVLNGTGAAGDTIDYTIVTTNTGNVTVDGIAVSDSLADADAALDCAPTVVPTTLAPGDSFTCTTTHTVTQPEVDASLVENTATAAGTDPNGDPVTDDSDDPDNPTDDDPDGDGNPDDVTTTPLVPVTEIQVTKVDTLNGAGVAGDTIDYTISTTNTGTVTVTITSVTDPTADGGLVDCLPTILPITLAPGESFGCSATLTLTQPDVDAGSVSNTASASGTDAGGSPVDDESDDPDDATNDDPDGDGEPDDPTVTPLTQTPSISVIQTDLLVGSGNPGDTIDYTITTTNDGTVTLTDVAITASLTDADASLNCAPTVVPTTLAPGEFFTCTATHTITQADVDAGEVTASATAAGLDHLGSAISDLSDDPTDAADTDTEGDGEPDDPNVTPLAQRPALNVIKTDSLNGTGITGDTVDYTITTTNTGNVTVAGVTVTDSLADADASLDCSPTVVPLTMAPGDSFTCTATHTITQVEVDAGQVENTATAAGTDPVGDPVTDDSDDPTEPADVDPDGDGDPDDPTVTELTPDAQLSVSKTGLLSGIGVAGDTITYTITTTNTGNVTVSGIDVTDVLADADASVSCIPAEAFTLAPGASATCSATHVVTQAEVDSGSVENTATATGSDPSGNPVTDDSDDPTDPTDVDPDGDGNPDDPTVTSMDTTATVEITKSDSLNGTGQAGDTVTYTMIVVNTGSVTLSDLDVTDSLADADPTVDCSPTTLPASLAPGASFTCTSTHTITQAEVDASEVVSTATVAGTSPTGAAVTDESDDPDDGTNVDTEGDSEPDDPTITPLVGVADISVTKSAILSGTGIVDDVITYTIEVQNTGILTVSGIELVDSLPGADALLTCGATTLPTTLTPGGSFTCTTTHTITQPDIDTGQVENVATATGAAPNGDPVTDDSDDPNNLADVDPDGDGNPDDPTITDLTPVSALAVMKTASIATTAAEGDQIDYTIVVANGGETTLTNVEVADPTVDSGSIDCSPAVLPATLTPGASFTCVAVHTVNLTDLGAQQVVNTAVATGLAPNGDPVEDDSDDPTDVNNVDPDADGDPDDPTVVALIPPVATNNTYTSPTPASPDNPTVVRVVIDDFDPDGTVDPTTVSFVDGVDNDGDGLNDELIVPGEGVWTIDRTTGQVTFTPEAGFTYDPTPVSYTVQDNIGLTSSPSDVAIDYPPVASPDSSVGNPFGQPVTVDPTTNDTGGDIIDPASVSLTGGTDTDGNGTADELVVAGQGVWTVAVSSGQITFTPQAGFIGNPTPIDYSIADDEGNRAAATVAVAFDQAPVTTVSGIVYNDLNNNGQRDNGEGPLIGAEVRITCSSDPAFTQSTTNAAGGYNFAGVPIGSECTVTVDGRTLGSFSAMTDDPDGTRDGETTVNTTAAAIADLNFGYRAPAQLSLTGRNSVTFALFALLMILIGSAFVVVPEWLEARREPEYW